MKTVKVFATSIDPVGVSMETLYALDYIAFGPVHIVEEMNRRTEEMLYDEFELLRPDFKWRHMDYMDI